MNIRTQSVAAVAFAALVGFAGGALAQPGQGRHAHHGPHGDFTMAIAAVKDKLDLNTSQQVMWDNAVAQGRSAREEARANFAKAKAALTAELAKPEPDLAAVAAASDDARAANTALRQQVRSQWLALYATFTPTQKAVVRDALQQRVARMEGFREKMMKQHRGS